jgi:hypothetical protein
MDPLAYPWEKFSNAVYALASEGPLQERILAAYMSFHVLTAKDFTDPDLREQFEEIERRLTVVKDDPQKGFVPATLDRMSDAEAREVASLIVEMTFSIASERRLAAENSR